MRAAPGQAGPQPNLNRGHACSAKIDLMNGLSLRARLWIAAALASLAACQPAREYELRGQILGIDRARQEVTIKHEDIRGFMPGMTMPFKVRRAELLDGRAPGDLIRATLVVEESNVYLRALESTGHASLAAAPPPIPALLNPGDAVPDATFIDQDGTARSLAEWKGRILAVTFIYTRCPVPDFCPALDRRFAEAQNMIRSDNTLYGRVHLLSVSFDPAFDTPPVLAAHAGKLGADPSVWTFLSGTRQEIERFGSRFGMTLVADAAGAPEIVHNLRTAIIDADGRLTTILHGNEWSAIDLIAELKKARGTRSNVGQR
jgi:protein SCO1/2